MVLSEDEALELLAFLVTAARTQVDEAAEYSSLRLLTAAGRLADAIVDRVSPDTRAFLTGPLKQVPDLAVRSADPAGYAASLDAVCRAVVECLRPQTGPNRLFELVRDGDRSGPDRPAERLALNGAFQRLSAQALSRR